MKNGAPVKPGPQGRRPLRGISFVNQSIKHQKQSAAIFADAVLNIITHGAR